MSQKKTILSYFSPKKLSNVQNTSQISPTSLPARITVPSSLLNSLRASQALHSQSSTSQEGSPSALPCLTHRSILPPVSPAVCTVASPTATMKVEVGSSGAASIHPTALPKKRRSTSRVLLDGSDDEERETAAPSASCDNGPAMDSEGLGRQGKKENIVSMYPGGVSDTSLATEESHGEKVDAADKAQRAFINDEGEDNVGSVSGDDRTEGGNKQPRLYLLPG